MIEVIESTVWFTIYRYTVYGIHIVSYNIFLFFDILYCSLNLLPSYILRYLLTYISFQPHIISFNFFPALKQYVQDTVRSTCFSMIFSMTNTWYLNSIMFLPEKFQSWYNLMTMYPLLIASCKCFKLTITTMFAFNHFLFWGNMVCGMQHACILKCFHGIVYTHTVHCIQIVFC